MIMKNIFGENWLTTLGGLVLALGIALELPLPDEYKWIARCMAAAGGAILGVGAKQFNVHSTQTEVRKATIKDSIKKADERQ